MLLLNIYIYILEEEGEDYSIEQAASEVIHQSHPCTVAADVAAEKRVHAE